MKSIEIDSNCSSKFNFKKLQHFLLPHRQDLFRFHFQYHMQYITIVGMNENKSVQLETSQFVNCNVKHCEREEPCDYVNKVMTMTRYYTIVSKLNYLQSILR